MASDTVSVAAAFEAAAAEGRAAFVPYITTGFPTAESTVELLQALEAGGADIIEVRKSRATGNAATLAPRHTAATLPALRVPPPVQLGVPFSDPLADGPTIQAANQRALMGGASVHTALEAVAAARAAGVKVPIILMGYLNPFLSHNAEGDVAQFVAAAAAAGAQGFIVVDLPPDEPPAKAWLSACAEHKLCFVPLVAPTTTDARLGEVAAAVGDAAAYVYCVSIAGVTGARTDLPDHLPAFISRVASAFPSSPLVVGFGISTPEHVQQVFKKVGAAGAVVGSAVVKAADKAHAEGGDAGKAVKELVQHLTSLK